MESYAHAFVLVVWALLLAAGMPLTAVSTATFLAVEAVAIAVYVRDVRNHFHD